MGTAGHFWYHDVTLWVSIITRWFSHVLFCEVQTATSATKLVKQAELLSVILVLSNTPTVPCSLVTLGDSFWPALLSCMCCFDEGQVGFHLFLGWMVWNKQALCSSVLVWSSKGLSATSVLPMKNHRMIDKGEREGERGEREREREREREVERHFVCSSYLLLCYCDIIKTSH